MNARCPDGLRIDNTLLRLLGLLRPFSGQVALSVLLGAATVSSGIGLLGLSAHLIASAALHPSIAELQVAIVGVRFFGISRAVFRYLERMVSHSVNFRLLSRLRVWFYTRLEPLAPARLQPYRSADLLSRAVADIETLENFYVRAAAPPLSALLVVAGTGWFVSRYDARLALLLVGMLLLAGTGVPALAGILARKPGRELVWRRAELNALLLDSVQGSAELLAYGQQDAQMGRIRAAGQALAVAQGRLGTAGALGSACMTLASGLALWLVLLAGIPLVGGSLDGVALAVLALVALASFEAVAPLPPAAQRLEDSLEAGRRLFDLVEPNGEDSSEEADKTISAGPLSREPLHLKMERVNFAYGAGELPALVDFNLDLPPGKHVALVGDSGAGKSTVINLLLRFWEPDSGRITLNGSEIRACDTEELRSRIALVAQSTYIFAGTLRQNILLANPQAGADDLIHAVNRASLGDLVERLPQGLDTWVGERGAQLSGGERQRVAAARALLRDAPLLLLDEPTANLDAHTERCLLEALLEAAQGHSLIASVHRLIAMDRMDEILVLRGGRVIERGTHAELLAARGVYAEMVRIQADMLR